jgi:glycosyltransferase involved in cell wall biosynthesis
MAPRKGPGLSEVSRQPGHVLYLSHNGLTEPLGRRQVLPYVVGLAARGWRMTVVSFEKTDTATPDAVASVEATTREAGIVWTPLRYHNRPPVIASAYDILRGYRIVGGPLREFDLIHARSTVPALMAGLASKRRQVPWIFDLRGLLGDEYVDAGHWTRGGIRHRVTAAVESRLIGSADGLVTLTRRILDRLPERHRGQRRLSTVIPCSVDLAAFRPSEEWRREIRGNLGWGDEPTLVYSGSLGSWYAIGEMLDFFERARDRIAGLRFLLLTPQVGLVEQEVQSRRVEGCVAAR